MVVMFIVNKVHPRSTDSKQPVSVSGVRGEDALELHWNNLQLTNINNLFF